jgi:hypothetical protein
MVKFQKWQYKTPSQPTTPVSELTSNWWEKKRAVSDQDLLLPELASQVIYDYVSDTSLWVPSREDITSIITIGKWCFVWYWQIQVSFWLPQQVQKSWLIRWRQAAQLVEWWTGLIFGSGAFARCCRDPSRLLPETSCLHIKMADPRNDKIVRRQLEASLC